MYEQTAKCKQHLDALQSFMRVSEWKYRERVKNKYQWEQDQLMIIQQFENKIRTKSSKKKLEKSDGP